MVKPTPPKRVSQPGGLAPGAANERGQILILAALSMTVLLGIAALSIDASYMYEKRNRLYAAADAAAKAAAIELHRSGTSNLQAFANHEIVKHGFDPFAAGTSVVLHHPPSSGSFTTNTNYVEVLLSQQTATFFGNILGWRYLTPAVRAVAGTSDSADCLVTLRGPGSSPPSLSIGNSTLALPGCGVTDGGDLDGVIPTAAICADLSCTTTPEPDVNVTGRCLNNCTNMGNLQTGAPKPKDPLSGLIPPPDPGGCTTVTDPAVVAAGCYDNMSLGANVEFGPGIYYVKGPILVGANVTITYSGAGLLIYLAGTAAAGNCTAAATAGCITVGQHVTMTLKGLTSAQTGCAAGDPGCLTGVLFFQASTDQLNAGFDGNNSTYNLLGALYFPRADVSFRNGLDLTNNCALIVAYSFQIDNGNGSLTNSGCDAAFGGSPLVTVSLAE